jgi:hypothetical protein
MKRGNEAATFEGKEVCKQVPPGRNDSLSHRASANIRQTWRIFGSLFGESWWPGYVTSQKHFESLHDWIADWSELVDCEAQPFQQVTMTDFSKNARILKTNFNNVLCLNFVQIYTLATIVVGGQALLLPPTLILTIFTLIPTIFTLISFFVN